MRWRTVTPDYSTTPLWRKLGLREGARVVLVGAPDGFLELLGSLAPVPPGVRFLTRAGRDVDVGILFTTRRSELERRFSGLASALRPDGRQWVAWPKKASKLDTDLTFATVQRHGLDAGLVDNKTASVDDIYQGCQFVYRVKDRPARRPKDRPR